MKLTAAICTNRAPAAVAAALVPLAAQTAAEPDAETLLVTSGLDPAAHALHAEAAARVGARASTAGPGLSVARNRALGEAGHADVIAYVDDDAIVDPGWLANLLAHWRAVSAEVACIGGAIDPVWERTPPAWVSPRINTAFSLLDLGPGVVELDPAADVDAFGANVSFRPDALREAGGFDPARGPWEGIPLFGDESFVQRRIAAAGHRLLYAGDVRVAHQVPADRLNLRGLWRREHYRGVSAALFGGTTPGAGAASAGKATAGLMVALAKRDAPLAGERFARVARGEGAAVSPVTRIRLRRRGWPG